MHPDGPTVYHTYNSTPPAPTTGYQVCYESPPQPTCARCVWDVTRLLPLDERSDVSADELELLGVSKECAAVPYDFTLASQPAVIRAAATPCCSKGGRACSNETKQHSCEKYSLSVCDNAIASMYSNSTNGTQQLADCIRVHGSRKYVLDKLFFDADAGRIAARTIKPADCSPGQEVMRLNDTTLEVCVRHAKERCPYVTHASFSEFAPPEPRNISVTFDVNRTTRSQLFDNVSRLVNSQPQNAVRNECVLWHGRCRTEPSYVSTIGGYQYTLTSARQACNARGLVLCTKQQVIEHETNTCSSGWTSDAGRGWWAPNTGDKSGGCGHYGWNTWARRLGWVVLTAVGLGATGSDHGKKK